jgi:hypothetical protein
MRYQTRVKRGPRLPSCSRSAYPNARLATTVTSMFNPAFRGASSAPITIRYSRGTAGRRIFGCWRSTKSKPSRPLSHLFVERVIGTMRREFLDHVRFWHARDLERKLAEFQGYYNAARLHAWFEGPHAADVRRRAQGRPGRSESCAVGLPL